MKNTDETRDVHNTNIADSTHSISNTNKQQEVNSPHDKGYKRSLSHPKEFLHFLKKYIGADWMVELEEAQLTAIDKEFINKDYEGREADLIYCVTKENGDKVYIFILQELQSSVDYTMIFRVVMYVVNTLLRYFMNTEKMYGNRVLSDYLPWHRLYFTTEMRHGRQLGTSGNIKRAENCSEIMC